MIEKDRLYIENAMTGKRTGSALKLLIEYVDNRLEEVHKRAYDIGFNVGYDIGNLDGSDESCIGGIHD